MCRGLSVTLWMPRCHTRLSRSAAQPLGISRNTAKQSVNICPPITSNGRLHESGPILTGGTASRRAATSARKRPSSCSVPFGGSSPRLCGTVVGSIWLPTQTSVAPISAVMSSTPKLSATNWQRCGNGCPASSAASLQPRAVRQRGPYLVQHGPQTQSTAECLYLRRLPPVAAIHVQVLGAAPL